MATVDIIIVSMGAVAKNLMLFLSYLVGSQAFMVEDLVFFTFPQSLHKVIVVFVYL
ncbi:hypothetical protein DSO57_1007064 [Entomophthora muscae]|uniref:Uncharacterized protein n=1 Tax=Entomophthora muscae TaxID=34485 RepID=A0ACC2S9G6_9FUNG|nr:hypothetical protein DSO57_1007064 [Entomophthora muscae]